MEKLKSAMILTVNSIDDKNISPKELASQLKSYKQLLNFTTDYGLKLREHYEKSQKSREIRNEIDVLTCTYMGKNNEVNKSIEMKAEQIKEIEKDLDCWKMGFYNTILNHIKYFNELVDKLYVEYESNINQKDFKSAENILQCISILNGIMINFPDTDNKSYITYSKNGLTIHNAEMTKGIKVENKDNYPYDFSSFSGELTKYINKTIDFVNSELKP